MSDYAEIKSQAIEAIHIMALETPDDTRRSGKIAKAFLEADRQRGELLAVLEKITRYDDPDYSDIIEAHTIIAKFKGVS